MRHFLAIVALLIIQSFTLAAQDWSWTTNANRILTNTQAELLVGDNSSVVSLGEFNIFLSDSTGTSRALLTGLEYNIIKDRPRLCVFPNGTFLAAGSATAMTASGAFRFDTRDIVQGAHTQVDFDGEKFTTGLSPGDVTVLGNTVMRLGSAFTFDAGIRWYYMTNSMVVGELRGFHYANNGSIYARRDSPGQWFRVDTTTRKYEPYSGFDSTVFQMALLDNGAGLATRYRGGYESDLLVRSSASAPWEVVPQLISPAGTKINPKLSVIANSQMFFATKSGKAVLLLDSGRAIVYDGGEVTVRNLDKQEIRGTLSAVTSPRPGVSDVIRAVYDVRDGSTRTYTVVDYSVVTDSVRVVSGLTYKPVDLNQTGYLSSGPYFTKWSTGVTRPAISIHDEFGTPQGQQYIAQVTLCGQTPVIIATSGEVFVVDSIHQLPRLHPATTNKRSRSLQSETVLQRVSGKVVGDTLVLWPNEWTKLISVNGGTTNLPKLVPTASNSVVTCATVDEQKRIVVAGNRIDQYDGTTWSSIPFPEQFKDSAVVISSIVVLGTDVLIASGRGYEIGSSAKDVFRKRRGGIAISSDGGLTWTTRPLPLNEQWVESLTVGPDGSLFCWATSMIFDESYGLPIDPMPRYGAARLYSSTNQGRTWTVLFVDEADEVVRRRAVDHQWAISVSGTGAIAISTPTAIYRSIGKAEPFERVNEFAVNAKFGGCALDPSGVLWAVGSNGIHRRTPTTSTASEENCLLSSLLVVPNPATSNISIRVVSTSNISSLPESMNLTSVCGTRTYTVPRSGVLYEISSQDIPSGAYVASAIIDKNIVSTRVLVLK